MGGSLVIGGPVELVPKLADGDTLSRRSGSDNRSGVVIGEAAACHLHANGKHRWVGSFATCPDSTRVAARSTLT